jgi:predicted transcriptional regulator
MREPTKLVAVKVRMTPTLKRKVEALAKKLNLSMNQVVAGAVAFYLAEHKRGEGN